MATETTERRKWILEAISARRHTTVKKLSQELGVSQRTVQRDIELLSLNYPIVTSTGRNGGVSFIDGYYYNASGFYITEGQRNAFNCVINLLEAALKSQVTYKELEVIKKFVEKHTKK